MSACLFVSCIHDILFPHRAYKLVSICVSQKEVISVSGTGMVDHKF